MDLPTCPACGQSVLDDVDECPFCGASMSGKPTHKRGSAPAPTAKAASSPPKPAVPDATSTSVAEGERPKPANDDPFAVDVETVRKAIPLRPRPTKGRRHKIVCPMCETPGYASSQVAGKEVRCANRECLVPVFTAPEIKSPEPAESPPEPSRLSAGVIVSAAIVLIAVVGVGVWYFVLRDTGQNKQPLIGGAQTNAGTSPGSKPQSVQDLLAKLNKDASNDGSPKVAGRTTNKPLSLAEMQNRALATMIEASQARTGNRSKPFCRRLTAEAYADIGDLAEAQVQLDQLMSLRPKVPYYQVTPLVSIAWRERESGQADAAKQTLEQAWQAAQGLPKFGRDSIDSATALATLLVAGGREAEARALLDKYERPDPLGELSARLQIVRALGSFDLDQPADAEPLLPWTAPQSVAVTLSLAAHGNWDEAFHWAQAHPDLEARTECVIAWAEAWTEDALQHDQPARLQRLETTEDDLPSAAQARFWSRVAMRQFLHGDQSRAQQSLDKAQTLVNSLSVPAEFTLPDMKGLYYLKLPDPGAFRMAAVACAETARVEAALGRPKEAWTALLQALGFARGTAPSVPAIEQRLQEIKSLGSTVLRNRLRAVLELDSDDEARRRFRTYRQQCRTVEEAAQARSDLQVALLTRLAEGELLDPIWTEVEQRAKHQDVDRREPYFQSSLPWVLATRFRDRGAAERAQAVESALAGARLESDPQIQMKRTSAQLIEDGRMEQAAKLFRQFETVDAALRQQWIMRLACRLVKSKGAASACQFALGLDDPLLREDTFEFTAALATKTGAGAQVWPFAGNSLLSPTERIALCRGLIAGAVASKRHPTR